MVTHLQTPEKWPKVTNAFYDQKIFEGTFFASVIHEMMAETMHTHTYTNLYAYALHAMRLLMLYFLG